MSSDLKKVNRELLEDFIRAYQSQPCLWRIKSQDYHDKAKKDAAYVTLLNKYRLIDNTADKDAVVKKINAFRTNYRREKKKVETSRRSGVGTDEIYEPSLWYYHLFEFLEDQETPRSSSSNFNEGEEEVGKQPTHSRQDLEESIRGNEQTSPTAHDTCTSPEEMPVQSTPKKPPHARPFKGSNDKCDSVLQTIEQHFKKPKPKEDRYDVFGKNVALKMSDISNNAQRLLAEKIINDTLFMAEMDQLTMSHSVNSSPTPSSAMGFPTSQHFNNNGHFSRSQETSYYEMHSPVNVNSDNSNQSLTSYVSSFSDA